MNEPDGENMHVALFCGSAVFFIALVYPYVIYPAILRWMPKRPYVVSSGSGFQRPTVALLFCAYNEERSLPAKIENLRQIKRHWQEVEVRAYTDCCSDNSVGLLRAAADVLILHEGLERTGKAAGMAEMVAATDADILVFTDANVLLDANAMTRMVAYFADPAIGTVGGTLQCLNANDGPVAWTGSLYWRLEESIKRLESETGSMMGADGSIFAMRRELYPDVPPDLLDDLVASIYPIFSGHRVVIAPDVLAYEKATTVSADEFRRKRRIACRAFNTHRFLSAQLRSMSVIDRWKYMSHKYLRWFSAGFLLLAVACALGGIAVLQGIYVAAIVLGISVTLFMLVRRLRLPVLGSLAEIIVSILAVGLGIAEALMGRNYQTWNPAKSRQ